MKDIKDVINYFPNNVHQILSNTLKSNPEIEENLQEIRIRIDRPILLKTRQADIIIDYKINRSRNTTYIRKNM